MEREKKYIETLLHMLFAEESLKEVKKAWEKYRSPKNAVERRNREIALKNIKILQEDLRKARRKAKIRGRRADEEFIKKVHQALKGFEKTGTKGIEGDVWIFLHEMGLVRRGEKRPELTERGKRCITALERYHARG